MSDKSFSSDQLHAAVDLASAHIQPLPPLDSGLKMTWWQDFLTWIDKQLGSSSFGKLDLEWLGGVFNILAWVAGLSLAGFLIYRLLRFYIPKLGVRTEASRLIDQPGANNLELATSASPRMQLRLLWKAFLMQTKLAHATTPAEYWGSHAVESQQPLSAEWLYQRMFGPSDPSSHELEMVQQRLKQLSRVPK